MAIVQRGPIDGPTAKFLAHSAVGESLGEDRSMDRKTLLSTLWVFATLNYVYADVVNLFDKAGTLHLSQVFLLGASVLVEIPIAMTLLSRILSDRASRWTCILAGAVMTVIQIATLFIGTPTYYYVFFSIIEIATTAMIVWLAWTWVPPSTPGQRDVPVETAH